VSALYGGVPYLQGALFCSVYAFSILPPPPLSAPFVIALLHG
jgi:hypothetical protein